MKTLICFAVLLLWLSACKHAVSPVKEKPVQIDTMQLIAPPATSVKIPSQEVHVTKHDSTTYIRFGDCYFSLDWINPDEPRNNNTAYCPDTLYFRLDHLRTLEGQRLAITTPTTIKIKVSQRYETSALINNEPLLHWKHYCSPWKALIPEASSFFICRAYSNAERHRFPITRVYDLLQYVKKQHLSGILPQLLRLSNFPAPPVHIDISRYYLKLEGLHKHLNKLLVIDVAFKG
ncbi:hypothetical protein ACDQ55_04090 [Chitinophaga sp. 30R24]|uniref:hypothetical protein n=1 Tax=Chitinophaga sp. 30R24 TaxID=3248838 RepID=UPI003B918FAE